MAKLIDLTGQRFGRLTVMERAENDNHGGSRWVCVCNCGQTIVASASNLKKGTTGSCGCLRKELQQKRGPRYDLTGQRFGRLEVLEYCGRKKDRTYWLCVCDCGNVCKVRTDLLKDGNTQSCGCIKQELDKERAKNLRLDHGLTDTRLHRIWTGMHTRTKNAKSISYKYYGGRGISVCEEWKDFQAFYDWAVTHGYDDSLTIDRIDVDGDYEPSNCRWATIAEQNRNKRTKKPKKE